MDINNFVAGETLGMPNSIWRALGYPMNPHGFGRTPGYSSAPGAEQELEQATGTRAFQGGPTLQDIMQSLPMPMLPQNMIFPEANAQGAPTFFGRHPRLTGALEGGLLTLANMPQQDVASVGDNIRGVAQGLMGMMAAKRNYGMQRAMMPMELMQKAIALKKGMAPEAIKTDAGIVYRDPLTGELKPGMSNMDIAKMNDGQSVPATDLESQILQLVPDADEREQIQLRSAAKSASQMWDPQKRAQYVHDAVKLVTEDRFRRSQQQNQLNQSLQNHQDNIDLRKQFHDDTMEIARQNLELRREANDRQNEMQDAKLDQLEPSAKKVIAETEPVKEQVRAIIERLEALKDNNQSAYFAVARGKYAVGHVPDPNDIEGITAADIADLELSKVTGAARIMRGSSRAYRMAEEAYKHLPNVWIDSPKMIHEKATKLLERLNDITNEAYFYGRKFHAEQPSDYKPPKGRGGNRGSVMAPPPNTAAPQTGGIEIIRDPKTGRVIGVK